MNDRLQDYRSKRDFQATAEPRGEQGSGGGKPIFVVQLHHATQRHFDFRLEVDGALRSWAVPKGPSRDPSTRRLAVQVEDHPLDYADFEGSIPAGSYGAGVVEIWDSGDYTCEDDPAEALDDGHLKFTLHGERLKGEWNLVRTGSKDDDKWLLIKGRDRHAVDGDEAELPDPPDEAQAPVERDRDGKPYEVQLATLVDNVPDGDWICEVKYDGYRVLMRKDGREVSVHSRNHQDWTRQLAHVAAAVAALDCERCVLDGELVMFDSDGISRFNDLQKAFDSSDVREAKVACFDLLERDGEDLRDTSCRQRREALETVLDDAPDTLRVSEVLDGKPQELRDEACEKGMEGIIVKDAQAGYSEGRNRHWLKLKCVAGDEFLAFGYTHGEGARAALGSLLLAEPHGESWRYVGRAGSGLDQDTIDFLLQRRTRKTAPDDIDPMPTRSQLRGDEPVWFGKPGRVVVEVDYRARTDDGLLRQPAVKGVRRDKDPDDLLNTPGDRDT